MGDTRYVPCAEGGNGGTVSQVTVLGDWDEELDPGDWWVVSQGSNGEGGKKGKKGKKRKRERRGAPSGCRGSSSSAPGRRRKPTSALRAALEEGDDGDDEDDEGDDKGEGGDKRGEEEGEEEGEKGGEKEGDTESRWGVPGARMRPGNPPPRRRGSVRVATREKGAGGVGG